VQDFLSQKNLMLLKRNFVNPKGNSRSVDQASPIIRTMKLDKQLKTLLRENDITVAQLARKAGVSAKTIYNWLEGQNPRDIGAVKKVADHFKVTLDFICYGTEPIKTTSSFEQHLDEIHAGTYEVILRRPKTKAGKNE
jgi:transcriptional regulator with XRE-family HTH domain